MTDTKKIVEFWKMLESNQFVKSTNSITNQVEEYPPAIQDMEAIVKINGEFDKYAIEEWLATKIAQAIAEELAELLLELLQVFNDYDVPLTMTAEQVREILKDYLNKKEIENLLKTLKPIN